MRLPCFEFSCFMQICDSQQLNIEIPIYLQIRVSSQCFQDTYINIYTHVYMCTYISDTENSVYLRQDFSFTETESLDVLRY